jgi:hypothetical protein
MKRAGDGHFIKTVNPLSKEGVSEIPEVEKWLASINSRGGWASEEQVRRIDTFVRTLKLSGVLPKLDRAFLVCAEDVYQSTTDLVATEIAQPLNGPEFAPNIGMRRYAQDQNLNLVFVPSPTGNYNETSTSFGVWTVPLPDEGTNKPPPFNGWGFSNRLAPDDLRLYINNAQSGGVITEPDLPLATQPFNAQGVPRDYADASWSALAAVTIGAGLDDADRTVLFNAVAAYLSDFGIFPPSP